MGIVLNTLLNYLVSGTIVMMGVFLRSLTLILINWIQIVEVSFETSVIQTILIFTQYMNQGICMIFVSMSTT